MATFLFIIITPELPTSNIGHTSPRYAARNWAENLPIILNEFLTSNSKINSLASFIPHTFSYLFSDINFGKIENNEYA